MRQQALDSSEPTILSEMAIFVSAKIGAC